MSREEEIQELASDILARAAFYRGLYGANPANDVERTLDEIDTLLAGVDEATAGKIMQLAYQLGRKQCS